MYVKTVLLTLMAWFLGLLLDANLDMEPQDFCICASSFLSLSWGFASSLACRVRQCKRFRHQ